MWIARDPCARWGDRDDTSVRDTEHYLEKLLPSAVHRMGVARSKDLTSSDCGQPNISVRFSTPELHIPKSSFQAPDRAPTLDSVKGLDCSISASMTLLSWKETLRELFKTTIIGGASFLLPVALVIFILSYALRLVRRIAEPISHSLHLDHLAGAGIGTVTVL